MKENQSTEQPVYYVGKVIDQVDVDHIEALFKRIRALEGALRDWKDKVNSCDPKSSSTEAL